ncbi:MAG: lysylphosphatidylglycerol synthase transmembrane domain-containing protein [Chloroflexota bacterium]
MAITVLAIVLILWFVDLPEVGRSLREANVVFILAGTVVFVFSLFVRSLAWRMMLHRQVSWSRLFFTINVGYLFNNLLPFRVGEVSRAVLLSLVTPLEFWRVASTILLERGFDILYAAGILLASVPFVVGTTWARNVAMSLGGVVVLGLVMLHFLARYQEKFFNWLDGVAARWKWIGRLGVGRLRAFVTGLEILTDIRQFGVVLFAMAVVWGALLVEYTLLLRAFIPEATWLWGAFALGIGALGVVVPSSPGFIGVVEASMMGALAVFGVRPEVALAYALTNHLVYFLVTIPLGLYGLTREGESMLGLFRIVRESRMGSSE